MKVHCVICNGLIVPARSGNWRHANYTQRGTREHVVNAMGRTGRQRFIQEGHKAVPLEKEYR